MFDISKFEISEDEIRDAAKKIVCCQWKLSSIKIVTIIVHIVMPRQTRVDRITSFRQN